MPDDYLLTEGRNGEVAVPDLTLTFRDSGLTLDKADGEAVRDSPWAGLEEMSPVERPMLPGGREDVVIEVVERGRRRRHRFVPANGDLDATEVPIRGASPMDAAPQRPGPRSRVRSRSWPCWQC